MYSKRRMIDESHGLALSKSGFVASSNECDPKAMGGRPVCLGPEERVEPVIFFRGEIHGPFSAALDDSGKNGPKFRVDWNGEVPAGVVWGPLGINEGEVVVCEINLASIYGRLVESTPGPEHYLKDRSHPRRPIYKRLSHGFYFVVREGLLSFLRSKGKHEIVKRVGICCSATNGLVHQQTEKLEFHARSIVLGDPVANLNRLSPLQKVLRMLVLDLARGIKAVGLQEGANRAPCDFHAPLGCDRSISVAGSEVGRYPIVKERAKSFSAEGQPFFNRGFLGRALGVIGLLRVVNSKPEGLLRPRSVKVANPKVPIRRSCMLSDMGHYANSHVLSRDSSRLRGVYHGLLGRARGALCRGFPTITLRGIGSPGYCGQKSHTVSKTLGRLIYITPKLGKWRPLL